MTFTRTISGLKNYPRFYGAEIVIYIEGRVTDLIDSQSEPLDQFFYKKLFDFLNPEKKIKFKCIGNKTTVLNYAKKIKDEKIENSLTIIDKDYDGIFCSLLTDPIINYTHKYSWENDFFNIVLAKDVLAQLTPQDSDKAQNLLEQKYTNVMRRIGFVSKLDCGLQIHGETILPKSGSFCGIAYKPDKTNPISRPELKRLTQKFRSNVNRSSELTKLILNALKDIKNEVIIQGHLLANLLVRLVGETYKKISGDKSISNSTITNLMLSTYSRDVGAYIELNALSHYRAILSTT